MGLFFFFPVKVIYGLFLFFILRICSANWVKPTGSIGKN